MKKVVFICFLMVVTIGFSQNLLTNGDFETGASTPWGGNSQGGTNLNVIDDGTGNFVNETLITAASTDVWRVSLDQAVTLTEGESYILSFVASADTDRTITAGLGKSGGDFFANTVMPTITTTPTLYTFTIAANFNTITDGSRVLFDLAASSGTVTLDNIVLELVATSCNNGVMDEDETGIDCGGETCAPCPAVPTDAPPTPPARAAIDVMSFYGEAYGTEIGLNNVSWDDPTNALEETIASNNVLKINFDQFLGTDFGQVVDASSMTHFHMDYWIADDFNIGQVFNLKLSNHTGGMGETDAAEFNIALNSQSDVQNWVSIDVPFTEFTNAFGGGIANRADLAQFIITVAGLTDTAYIDNIYFHNNTVLSVNTFITPSLKIFPNPTHGSFTISSQKVIDKIEIYDVLGQFVMVLEPKTKQTEIAASELKSGIYFARIQGVNLNTTAKLIKD